MPTETGGETIGERLERLRAELTRVDAVISRSETNGRSFDIGGTAVTQIAYERAVARAAELRKSIKGLEDRHTGNQRRRKVAIFQTKAH